MSLRVVHGYVSNGLRISGSASAQKNNVIIQHRNFVRSATADVVTRTGARIRGHNNSIVGFTCNQRRLNFFNVN
jgi:hypothetical protein